jgi:hypothetical protein
VAAHSVQHALSTRDCRWPGCPDDGIHDEPGGPLCERHYRLQTHGSTLPVPARCDECRALLTGAHSEACSSYVEIRKPPTPEVKVPAALTRCKRPDCTEAATAHSLTVRSNRYRQLCQAHYDAERAKSIRPQRNGAPVTPDPAPPAELAVPPEGLEEVACDDGDPHYSHEWTSNDPSLPPLHCPGAAGLPRTGEPEAPRPRALKPMPGLPLDDPPSAPLPPSPFDLVGTLEETDWTPTSRIRSAYVGAIEDAFAALSKELTEGTTNYSPGPLLDSIGALLGLADKVRAAIDAVADEVPSAG